uniref:Xanthine dehydrogenase n=2 Tax=Acrobeloides nanus TaxID=290746 RepID=A0A914EMA0_9BILA
MHEKVLNVDQSFDQNSLLFYVNGKRVEDQNVDPRTTLATYLRENLKLTGTKIGCNEGGCGACTIMVSDLDPATDEIRHYSVNACLTPVCSVFGKAVITVEGIGSVAKKRLHPIQERLSVAHGSQCGYCTPGFVMAMYALLRNKPKPNMEDVDEAIQGNLCRCTGYRPILEAFYTFTENAENGTLKNSMNGNSCPMGEKCCKMNGNSKCNDTDRKEATKLSSFENVREYDETQELIFPAELKLNKWHRKSFYMSKDGFTWYQPNSLEELLKLKSAYPNSRLISGNTEIGVEMKFRFIEAPMAINIKQVPELREYNLDNEKGLYLGMGLSLNEVKQLMEKYIAKLPKQKTQIFKEVQDMLYYFAGKHVRNMATIAGNIATASPISDLNPIWMASCAQIILASKQHGEKILPIDENFFLGYRKPSISADEVIKGIWVPYTKPNQFFRAYKQAQRREDDISIVTGAFLLELNENDNTIENLKISFGGMAPVTKLALETVTNVKGRKIDETLLEDISNKLTDEFKLPPDVPGGMPQFRQALTLSFWLKFYNEVSQKLKDQNEDKHSEMNGVSNRHEEKYHFTQVFAEVPETQKPIDPVGRPIMHASGEKHVTGEAIYSTDIQVAAS